MWNAVKRFVPQQAQPDREPGTQPHDAATVIRAIEIHARRARPGVVECALIILSPFAIQTVWDGVTAYGSLDRTVGGFVILAAAVRLLTLQYRFSIVQAVAKTPGIDKCDVSSLIEIMNSPRRYIRKAAALHLCRLLPELTSEDRSLLLPGDMAGLARCLTPWNALKEPELVTAFLHACCELGGSEVHPWLVNFASYRAFTPSVARIRNLALAALVRVEERLAQPESAVTAAFEPAAKLVEPGQLMLVDAPAVEASAEVRQAAEQALAELGLDKLGSPSLRLPFFIAAWIVIIPYAVVRGVDSLANHEWVVAAFFAVLGIMATQLQRFVMTSQHLLLVGKLAAIDDIRIVGQLASALAWPNDSVRIIVAEALAQRLPKLKASDSGLLNAAQRDSIYKMLKMSNASAYYSFIVATLQALEQVGDNAAMPYVRELAEAVPASGTQRAVCLAAQHCMPFLELRADQTSQSQTLLRGSSLTPVGQEALLRPSSRLSDEGAEVLLRPGA